MRESVSLLVGRLPFLSGSNFYAEFDECPQPETESVRGYVGNTDVAVAHVVLDFKYGQRQAIVAQIHRWPLNQHGVAKAPRLGHCGLGDMGGSRGGRDRSLIGDGDKILQLLKGVVQHLPSVGDEPIENDGGAHCT